MKSFNDFLKNRMQLQKVIDNLSESDGIMIEAMFYEFAEYQALVNKKSLINGKKQASVNNCPNCNGIGWFYEFEVCACHG